MAVTNYRCSECNAEDSDRTDSPPHALHCWNCGAGRRKQRNEMTSVADILMLQVGMLKQTEGESSGQE